VLEGNTEWLRTYYDARLFWEIANFKTERESFATIQQLYTALAQRLDDMEREGFESALPLAG